MMSLKKLLGVGALLLVVALVMNFSATTSDAGHYGYSNYHIAPAYHYGCHAPAYQFYAPSYYVPTYGGYYGGFYGGCYNW